MGQRVSRDERARRDAVRATAVQEATDRIRSGAGCLPGVVATNQPHFVTQMAATQMERGGAPFTKADLVALMSRINGPSSVSDLMQLNQLTVPDLRTAIRLKLYDPDQQPSWPIQSLQPRNQQRIEPKAASSSRPSADTRSRLSIVSSTRS